VIIYTNPSSTPGIWQEYISLEYAAAQEFPRHHHRKRKMYMKVYSGNCVMMHFSLLRDGNNTNSPSSSFTNILLHFFVFLTIS